METINKTTVKKMIFDYIENEQKSINEHNEIKEILKKCEGKPFNGTTFRNKLNNYTFSTRYNMYYITKESGTGYDHLIGYAGNLIDSEKFENFDNCCGSAALERIEQLKNIDVEKIVSLFGTIEKSVLKIGEAFQQIESNKLGSYYNPIFYSLMKSFCNFTTFRAITEKK